MSTQGEQKQKVGREGVEVAAGTGQVQKQQQQQEALFHKQLLYQLLC